MEEAVFPAARRAVEEQHAGSVAGGKRALGDALGGKVVIEVADVHSGKCLFAGGGPADSIVANPPLAGFAGLANWQKRQWW